MKQIFQSLLPLILLIIACEKNQSNIIDKPNIIFIMSDDHTSQAIGAYKSRLSVLNPTPTIDRLSKEWDFYWKMFFVQILFALPQELLL